MSNISKYLKMNYQELENEISKQNKKIASAKETISLLKKLQVAVNNTTKNQGTVKSQHYEKTSTL